MEVFSQLDEVPLEVRFESQSIRGVAPSSRDTAPAELAIPRSQGLKGEEFLGFSGERVPLRPDIVVVAVGIAVVEIDVPHVVGIVCVERRRPVKGRQRAEHRINCPPDT